MAKHTAGTIARDLANAPIVQPVVPVVVVPPVVEPQTAMAAALTTAIVESMQAEQARTIAPVVIPFKLAGFKLNGKAKDYPSDDDPSVVSRKVAFAVLTVGDTGYKLLASIYRVTHTTVKNDAGKTKVVTRCTMPNSGKMGGFKPIIDTDDPREQRALDDLRAHIVGEFKTWLADTNGAASVTTKIVAAADESVDFE